MTRDTVISMNDVGVRFRMWRRNRAAGSHGSRWRARWKLWGIRHLTLDVERGEVIGIIGSNGAGKSTLLKTVARIYRPDEGTLRVSGRVAPLLSPAAGLLPGLNGWHNLELAGTLLGLSRREARELLPTMGEFAGLGDFLDAPVRTYSSGMKARLGFSAAVHCDPDIVLLDEIMAVGDRSFRETSRQRIRDMGAAGCTILITSHEVETLAGMSHRLLWLEKGEVVELGPPDEVLAHYVQQGGSLLPARPARP